MLNSKVKLQVQHLLTPIVNRFLGHLWISRLNVLEVSCEHMCLLCKINHIGIIFLLPFLLPFLALPENSQGEHQKHHIGLQRRDIQSLQPYRD